MFCRTLKTEKNLAEIRWDFNFRSQSGEIEQMLELGDFLCTPTVKLSFHYHVIKVDDKDEFCEADVHLNLKQILSASEIANKESVTGEMISDCHHRPRVVRFQVNKLLQWIHMKPLSSPANWKSDTFVCKLYKNSNALKSYLLDIEGRDKQKSYIFSNPNDMANVQFKIWIEFTDSYNNGRTKTLIHLTKLYFDQKYCDVQFHFEDESSIGGHTCILSARSPVFAAMFEHEMEESKTGQVQIEDIKSNIFRQLLVYIYSGQTLTCFGETAQSLYEAADKYEIEDLMKECVDYLSSHITVDNVIQMFIWGSLQSVDEVQDSALNFMEKNSREICLQEDWADLLENYSELGVKATRRMIK